jgi:hypothetical protein
MVRRGSGTRESSAEPRLGATKKAGAHFCGRPKNDPNESNGSNDAND